MALDTLSTNFVDFINYTFLVFSVQLLTTGMFLSYPIEFIKVAFSILGYARDNGDETDAFLMLIIVLVNFSVIAWIGGLITRFWGNKIFIKTDKVEEI